MRDKTAAREALAPRIGERIVRRQRWSSARGGARQGRPDDARWSASSRSCRASWAAITPRREGEPAGTRAAPSRSTTGRALPATRCRTTRTGQALALADKIDTLVGIFAIEQRPTGTKDPFGLRRAALGVLRILLECRLDLDLHELLARRPPSAAGAKRRSRRRRSTISSPSACAACCSSARTARAPKWSMRCWRFGRVRRSMPSSASQALKEFLRLPRSRGADRHQQAHRQHPARRRRRDGRPTVRGGAAHAIERRA